MTPSQRPWPLRDLDDLHADPVEQFRRWYDAPYVSGRPMPEAVTLATATPDGVPSARTVLLRGFAAEGFRFYTNLQSRKGVTLQANPRAAMLFYWEAPSRQVVVEGGVERLPDADSDAYFAQRPRDSQLGAWASPQSREIPDRATLDAAVAAAAARFGDGPVPRPPHWGGFLLQPTRFEFWEGREARLHDRFHYVRAGASWRRARLAP